MQNKKKAITSSAVAISVLVIAQLVSQILASTFLTIGFPAWICNILAGVLYAGTVYGIFMLWLERKEELALSNFGMPKFHIEGRWLFKGLLLPAVVVAVYLLMVPGEYVISQMGEEEALQRFSAGIFYTGIAAGFVEEMVFRGVILHLVEKAWSRRTAIFVSSVLFGFVHILGNDYSLGSSFLVVLAGTVAGVMFSLIALESGSVWNSGIVHCLWNIVILGGFLTIGEAADGTSFVSYILHTSSFALTGGDFGIESSAIALLGYMIAAGSAIRRRK